MPTIMTDSFELNRIFQSLLGNGKASLYSYQEKVSEYLLSAGKNVILRAPTGAGKTWAALLPYLYACKFDLPFVDKVFYALPLRSLASQLYQSTADACDKNVKEFGDIIVKIQTGERQDDPFFQGDIVFTTIDQLLSSYLFSPVSLPRRLANINAGALPSSLIVFDEFHLLDPARSMGTALEMLDRLNGLCRFILMTATLSDEAVSFLGRRLQNTVLVDLSAPEIRAIEEQKNVDLYRVGRNDITLQYDLDPEERQNRVCALLKSVLYTFVKIGGAHRNTQLPHILDFSGVVATSIGILPPPTVSALKDDYLDEIELITKNLSAVEGGGGLTSTAFSGLGEFSSVMGKIINSVEPWGE